MCSNQPRVQGHWLILEFKGHGQHASSQEEPANTSEASLAPASTIPICLAPHKDDVRNKHELQQDALSQGDCMMLQELRWVSRVCAVYCHLDHELSFARQWHRRRRYLSSFYA